MPAISNRPRTPVLFVQRTVSSTALPLLADTVAANLAALKHASGLDAVTATINPTTDAIRYRTDGTAPTAAIGILVPAAAIVTIEGLNTLQNFRMIRVTADSTVNVEAYL